MAASPIYYRACRAWWRQLPGAWPCYLLTNGLGKGTWVVSFKKAGLQTNWWNHLTKRGQKRKAELSWNPEGGENMVQVKPVEQRHFRELQMQGTSLLLIQREEKAAVRWGSCASCQCETSHVSTGSVVKPKATDSSSWYMICCGDG